MAIERTVAAPPVRVAIVSSEGSGGRGGIGRILNYLTRELAVVAPDVIVSVHRARFSDRAVLKHATVPLALALFAVRCIVGRVDIVHLNIAPRGSTWRKRLYHKTARALGKRVVVHLHGSGYNDYCASLSPARQAKIQAFFSEADVVVTLSAFWTGFVAGELGVPTDRIVEIPNGVPAAPPPLDKPARAMPCIAFLGIVGQRKGTDVLLEALAALPEEAGPWRAVIGGNGEVDAGAEQARSLGIADRVDFLGWVGEEQVDATLRNAAIFVLPSRAENQPVSILEAMARATPVIATSVGAIPEQVSDGTSGLIVPPGDAPALTTALATLLRNPEQRVAMGAAGLARFERSFSVTSCAERFAALYRSLRE